MMNLSNIVLAQDVSDKTVLLDKVVISESAIRLEGIINKSGHDVEIKIQNGFSLMNMFFIFFNYGLVFN